MNLTSRLPRIRRAILFSLVTASTTGAVLVLGTILAAEGFSILELGILALFGLLFAWITTAFWTSCAGFVLHLIGRHGHRLCSGDGPMKAAAQADQPASRTALVMPVYNEDPERVLAGLQATLQSLLQCSAEGRFDLFILSDSTDPEVWLAEELAWSRLNREFAGKLPVYYRHRPKNLARKSGNIADFCESWGYLYDYMIVLDADSIMSGQCLVQLVRRMDANPQVGLIQVPPVPVLRESLFARSQQFAASVFGPIFATGLSFWFEGGSNYWGHNAIIRLAPFMAHCGLPNLPGREPFGGEILSHDFVEAALLRRAGWEVWLADDLSGSFEEPPPTLIDHAKRDRRWCQGNLQHLRIVFAEGLKPLSRLHLGMGIMSYLSSVFWFLLLLLSGLEAWRQGQIEHSYFIDGNLFPNWPVSYAFEATTLLAITLSILYLPKLLGYLALFLDRRRLLAHGGALKAGLSLLLESLTSILLAPILMLFQMSFVVSILAGRSVRWAAQQRDDGETSWAEATAAHFGHCAVALVAGWLSFTYVPEFFFWLTPVLLGPALSIPLSRFTSRVDVGQRLLRWGIFLTPCETDPPRVLQDLTRRLAKSAAEDHGGTAKGALFERAIADPFVNALHLTLLKGERRSRSERLRLDALIARLQEQGPASLSKEEKRDLLSDSKSMTSLHALAWRAIEEGPAVLGPGTFTQTA
ncbi:glucans biosynthesis glucosyltransferase MdoH [Pelagibius litoralis]|uniref:Glucans biosynthesis glucosyltransferase H n=1 Tax=Pelagibius litoralis TaxID=374515 RepID=A0A967C207_9PROT|nr:glucans biosynthesis glucosyltransferase MdoH [Pelagibius litoralis]NIA67493.1 glucans biosynthesis glucosyltransferase MdoH [Pelagibius litoralis]